MNFQEWAARWQLPAQALDELADVLNSPEQAAPQVGVSESATSAAVRLEASARGVTLWRNNVGVLKNEAGRPVRYGLANDSPQINRVFKSSDLIGVRPRIILAADVGRTFGQFVARECKHAGWPGPNPNDKHEQAQLAFLRFVVSRGGDAAFCTGTVTI